jgi:hypothetical protein
LSNLFPIEEIKKLANKTDFDQYRSDPVGFCEDVLNEEYTDDVKIMMESVRDNIITVAKSSNATGKTHGAARVAVWWYKAFSDSQVYTGAAPPESNLKRLLWGEIGSLTERHPNIFVEDKIHPLLIQRSAQSFISGVTIPSSGTAAQREAKFAGKHSPNLLFILDEGDAIPDEVFRGVESCMTGGHARLLVMFNPRAEMGEVYRMERDRRAHVVALSAFKHPNVVQNEEVIPGAVTRETTVRRVNQWCRPLVEGETPDSECFELPEFLSGAESRDQNGYTFPALKAGHYKILDPAFSYMVLGEYPAQSTTQLISREWIAKARSRWDAYVAEHGEKAPEGTQAIMGLDVAEFGTDANVAAFRYGGFVERMITWSGMDTIQTAERAAEQFEQRKKTVEYEEPEMAVPGAPTGKILKKSKVVQLVSYCNVDGTGVGAGVAPYMERKGVAAYSIKVASSPTYETEIGEFGVLRDQIWWEVREWLRADPGSMLPPDDMLLEELQTPTYEVKGGKIKIMAKDTLKELLKRSPDRADALGLTFAPAEQELEYAL